MNKLSNITKQMVNQPTRLGSTGVGGSASISKWATVTKYLGLGLLVLAIMATAIMNAVGGGLSRLRQYQSAGAVNDTNSGISTYAAGADGAASIISFTFTNATGGASDGRNVAITSPDGGGIATGRHTMNVATNSIAGYTVTVEGSGSSTALSPVDFGGGTTTNNHLINPVAGTLGSPSVLGSNTWGMAIPGHSGYSAESVYTAGLPVASGGTNGGVENAANQATLQIATFGQIPTKTNAEIVLESNQASGPSHDGAAADTQNIYYGANVESTLQAGEYSAHITYTATVKLPPAPTNLSVQPNQYELGSGEPNTITISATSGLASTYNVWIDLNSNNTYDANEQCTNLNVASDTTLTCNIPTDESITTDTPYTIYVQTQASMPTPITNAFTYTKQTGITTITDGTVAVDIDDGMIPVIYNDGTSNWESLTTAEAKTSGTWYDYGAKKWANAVTVKNPDTYKNQHKTVSSSDILGYWVYIPRYAYKVMRYSVNDKYVSDSTATSNGGFEIVFETKDTPKKIPTACSNSNSNQYYQDCSNVSQDYGATTGTAWATHPAFTWGTEELNGFWIGKFETTGTRTAPTVKPNQHANVSEYIGEFYSAAKSIGVEDKNNQYGGASSDDTTSGLKQNSHNLAISTSHMLKNSEWGAVAYLSASKYGAGVNNVQINSAYPSSSTDADGTSSRYGITGCGPSSNGSTSTYTDGTALNASTIESPTACSSNTARAYNGSLGVLASTTNNVYGVYDMSGGAWEYVMGSYTTNASQSSTNYFSNATKPPYVDLYVNSTFSGTYYTNNNLCTWTACGGHALYETKNVQSVSGGSQAWGGEYSYFVDSSYPWFLGGGNAGGGSFAVVFASYGNDGRTGSSYGFRVALLSLPQG